MKILITGAAGFIGFSLARYLCSKYKKIKIIGIDNINSYYSIKYKKKRIKELKKNKNFKFKKIDLNDYKNLENIFKTNKFKIIFNFAAQAGVRYSIKFPKKYISSNIQGFFNILDLSKKYNIKKLLYASSSSVYGERKKFPTKENELTKPNNVYSLSKTFNENIAEIYSELYGLKAIGLRFFTVYGKWGRPDMFLFKIFYSVLSKKVFKLNNSGRHYRDFTSINDVNKILDKLLNKKMKKKHQILNICSSRTVNIKRAIRLIKKKNKLKVTNIAKNVADLIKTHGSNKKLISLIGNYKFEELDNQIYEVFDWYKKNKINKIT